MIDFPDKLKEIPVLGERIFLTDYELLKLKNIPEVLDIQKTPLPGALQEIRIFLCRDAADIMVLLKGYQTSNVYLIADVTVTTLGVVIHAYFDAANKPVFTRETLQVEDSFSADREVEVLPFSAPCELDLTRFNGDEGKFLDWLAYESGLDAVYDCVADIPPESVPEIRRLLQ